MKTGCCFVAIVLLGITSITRAEDAAKLSALAKLPVKEITIFKDGHAFVLHEGSMPTDAAGNVQMDYLPTPVIGTFWPYSANKAVKLTAVTASPHRVLVERTALSPLELLEANPGAEVGIEKTDGKGFDAHIVGFPSRSAQELRATNPPNTGDRLPEKSSTILLKTVDGVQAMDAARIQAVTFKGAYKTTLATEEFRNLLTLKLDWPAGKIGKTADVGMVYLQKGVRWIPSYKVTIDGKGVAAIALQASVINEMTDLDDVTANLVIGVPSFAFQDTLDPIALEQAVAQLSPYFQSNSQTNFAFSNAIASQVAGYGGGAAGPAGPSGRAEAGPEVGGSAKTEDTFVFTIKHLTLKKGQRMTLPVAEYTLKYRDKYTVDLPYAPPRELRANNPQQVEMARLMGAPKALHKICLTNDSKFPLTTAPALILRGDQVLAQGMMTYAAIGGSADLTLTTAVDIRVKKSDKEILRTPNAQNWQGDQYARVDLAGTVTLTSSLDHAVDVEVTRNVLGNVTKADHDGVAEMVNVFEDDDYAPRADYPAWWGYYNWPSWWNHFNGIGRIMWKVRLEPSKSVDLGYTWHYFWR